MTQEPHTPVYKVGAVVVRDIDTEPKFLLVKPIPKGTDGNAPWVLPRGTCRAYDAASNMYVDLRREIDIQELGDAPLEDYDVTMVNELNEEAGIKDLDPKRLTPLGVKIYHKSTEEHIPVYWFGMVMPENEVANIDPKPIDAAEPARWVTLEEMKALASEGKARHGYIEICKEALSELRTPTHER